MDYLITKAIRLGFMLRAFSFAPYLRFNGFVRRFEGRQLSNGTKVSDRSHGFVNLVSVMFRNLG